MKKRDEWIVAVGSILVATKEELLQMADQVGVARKWIQNEDTPREHFDICQAKRAKAIALGAVVISRREMVMLRKKKEALVTDSHFNQP